jgi:hypothetical protein
MGNVRRTARNKYELQYRPSEQRQELVLDPIFEAGWEPNAYGYHSKRGGLEAIEEVAARGLHAGLDDGLHTTKKYYYRCHR